jgi:gliding motility-associated-like protein
MKKLLFTFLVLIVSSVSFSQNCNNLNLQIDAKSHTSETDSETDMTFYNICLGSTLILEAKSRNNNASYIWLIDDQEKYNTQIFTHTFEKSGGYTISLVESNTQCRTESIYIRVGFEPTIQITPETVGACPGVDVSIGFDNSNDILIEQNIAFETKWTSPVCEDDFSDPTYLKDIEEGFDVSYETSIEINCFEEGQKINSISDINEIQLNIEHSFTGDLDILLMAPNGAVIVLFEAAGDNVWFGEATDNDATQLNQGRGFDYGWSMNPSYNGTMTQGLLNNLQPSEDLSANILISDTYLPIQNFEALKGSPLNGTWTMIITDTRTDDNGWVFSWGIKMNEELLPDTWSVENSIVSGSFQNNPTIITNTNESIKIQPETGNNKYTYQVKDNFGCTHTKDLNVLAAEIKANFEVTSNRVKHLDAMVEFNNLSIPNTNEIDYYWDFGNGDYSYQQNPQYNFYNIGARYVKLTVTNKEGCKDTYSRKITTEEDYKLWVPTAFSPNGDGINDYFKLILENVMDNDYSLFIYDSWGKLVFETNDINLGWDGRRKDNGIKAAGGSYTFVSQFTNKQNQIEEKVGTFFLLE